MDKNFFIFILVTNLNSPIWCITFFFKLNLFYIIFIHFFGFKLSLVNSDKWLSLFRLLTLLKLLRTDQINLWGLLFLPDPEMEQQSGLINSILSALHTASMTNYHLILLQNELLTTVSHFSALHPALFQQLFCKITRGL